MRRKNFWWDISQFTISARLGNFLLLHAKGHLAENCFEFFLGLHFWVVYGCPAVWHVWHQVQKATMNHLKGQEWHSKPKLGHLGLSKHEWKDEWLEDLSKLKQPKTLVPVWNSCMHNFSNYTIFLLQSYYKIIDSEVRRSICTFWNVQNVYCQSLQNTTTYWLYSILCI